jgi:WD40 repeat protein
MAISAMSATVIFTFDAFAAAGKPISALAFGADGALLSIAAEKAVVVVTWSDRRIVARLEAPAAVSGIAFSPDGRRLAISSAEDLLTVVDLPAGTSSASVASAFGGFASVAWSPDGRWIAAGNYEPFVDIVDAVTGNAACTLDPDIFSDEGRTALLFLPDGRLAVTAYNRIVLWTLPPVATDKRKPRRRTFGLSGHAFVVDIALEANAARITGLVHAEDAASLYLWDARTLKTVARSPAPIGAQRIAWQSGAATIAVAGEDGVVFHNADAGLAAFANGAFDAEATAIAAHPREPVVAVGNSSGHVVVLNFEDSRA